MRLQCSTDLDDGWSDKEEENYKETRGGWECNEVVGLKDRSSGSEFRRSAGTCSRLKV